MMAGRRPGRVMDGTQCGNVDADHDQGTLARFMSSHLASRKHNGQLESARRSRHDTCAACGEREHQARVGQVLSQGDASLRPARQREGGPKATSTT